MSTIGLLDRQCFRSCDRFSIFDQKIAVEKLTGLTLLGESIESPTLKTVTPAEDAVCGLNYVASQDKFSCTLCNVDFADNLSMREHHKCDWHLHNVTRALAELKPLSEDVYTDCIESNTVDIPVHPIADSPDKSADDHHMYPQLRASSDKQLIFFRNKSGEVIGIHRCVLFSKKSLPTTMDELLARVTRVRQSRRWAVLLYSGGKFAGGIFDGNKEVVHKTLSHYTVRAKQGGGQSSYDAATGGMGSAKSAGASLRRHGEQAIRNEISHLLHNRWRSELQSCQYIFLWSPKVHASIFFIPPSTPLDVVRPAESLPPDTLAEAAVRSKLGMVCSDARVFRIPCRTKHINYAQVKQLHKDLSTFLVYDSHVKLEFVAQSKRKQLRRLSESGDSTVLETRSGRLIYGSLSELLRTRTSSTRSCSTSTTRSFSSFEDNLDELSSSTDQTPNPESLEPSAEERITSCASNTLESKEDPYSIYQSWHRRVRVAVAAGEYFVLLGLLPALSCSACVQLAVSESPKAAEKFQSPSASSGSPSYSSPPPDVCTQLLNHPLNEDRRLLHIAVEFQNDPNVVTILLESGCDPSLRDCDLITPYMLASKLQKKALCNAFRRFRHAHPDRYNYELAQIPTPLDPIKEALKVERERERARKQRQRVKEKRAVQRELEQKEREEQEEKARFLALSDREKRALIAERRIVASKVESNLPTPVLSRCFQCACDITGKVPFTYFDLNFCSPSCLKAHRTSAASRPKI